MGEPLFRRLARGVEVTEAGYLVHQRVRRILAESDKIAAAFEASGRERLVFAPAFPAAGRTTEGGVQLVDGAAVSESVYADDPVHPARTAWLAELVDPGIDARCVTLGDARTQAQLDALDNGENK